MALTRAQLLAGNSTQGVVLPGQVQAVTAGAGIAIDANGVISVNAATTTGLVKLNNATAYNAYIWPNADGAANSFLQTNGAGTLVWTNASGFAVVTVSGTSPTPVTEGELWYDCTTGTLKVYQSCVAPAGWTSVAQTGLPVLPANTSASPAFTGGSGTSGDPYLMTVTTVGTGGTAVIVNTVTVTGLAPGQYVPIVDLNAATNGGRFSFTNNYADGTGTLTFQTIFDDSPASTPGTNYTASIRVGNATVYISSQVNVVAAVTLPGGGTISGTPYVGSTLTYTPAVASGGVTPYTYTWSWKRASNGATLQTGSGAGPQTYVIPSSLIGDQIYVQEVVTDANGQYATASTSTVPTGSDTIENGPFPSTTINFPTTTSGTANTTWNEAGTTAITGSGCIEFSINGGAYTTSGSITSSQTLTTRWLSSAPCGGAASGTTITGTITGGVYQQSGSLTIDRVPETFPAFTANTGVPLNSTTSSNDVTPSGYNGTAYVTYNAASSGSVIQGSTDGGTTWVAIPTSGTSFPINPGQTLRVRMLVGSSVNTGYTAIINLGIAGSTTSQTFTATTVTSAGFPNLPSSLSTGPTQIPQTSLGTWADGPTNLTSTGCIQISLDGSTWGTGPLSLNNGNTLYERWDPTSGSCGGAIDGATITGTITGNGYTNSYSLTLDRSPSAFTIPTVTNQALSSVATSSVVTLAGTNAPAYITYTAGSPNTLTSLQVSVAGGAYVAVPTSGTTVSANPGATLQFRGTVGGTSNTTYTATVNIGTTSSTWSVSTVTATPSIQTPSIQTPASGATNVGAAAGVTLTGDAYTPLNGAGATQTSATWQVYQGSRPLTSTNSITAVAQNPASAWTSLTSGTTQALRGVSYGNNIWMVTGGEIVGRGGTVTPAAAFTSTDGVTWTPRPLPVNNQYLYNSHYAQGKWVAVGTLNYYSTDNGVTWTNTPSPAGASYNNVSYGTPSAGGSPVWVMVGSLGEIGVSSDGTSWTRSYYGPTTGSNLSVATSGTRWVLVGSNGMGYSTDPATPANWFNCVCTPALTNTMFDIEYGGGKFVAVGYDNLIYTSTDGINFTKRTSPAPSTTRFNAVTYASVLGLWVATGYDSAVGVSPAIVVTSTDGVTWSLQTQAPSSLPNGIGSNGKTFIAAGAAGLLQSSDAPAGTATLTISGCQTDGFGIGDTVLSSPSGAGPAIITTLDNSSVTVSPYSSSWAAGQQLTVDSATYSAISGSPFTDTTAPFTSINIAKPPLAANTKYFARVQYATTNASAATSSYSAWSGFTTGAMIPTANTWASSTAPVQFNTVAYGNGIFVATERGGGGRPYTSTDGVNWTLRTWSNPGVVKNLTYQNGLFIASIVSNGAVLFSSDGITWSGNGFGFSSYGDVVWDGTQYVGHEGSGGIDRIMTSSDLLTWTPARNYALFNQLEYAMGEIYYTCNYNGTVGCISVGPPASPVISFVCPNVNQYVWALASSGTSVVGLSNGYTTKIVRRSGGTWTEIETGQNGGVATSATGGQGLTYGNGMYILGNQTAGWSRYSNDDGLTWNTISNAVGTYCAAGNGICVMVGDGTNVYTSVS